ncbi:MAG: RHS repeat-associated core domain-containing protein [Candidatus Hydrogenedentes bacterium]|nr:RHS repeat-associated core domain-containing protein [Candidatus Hydrogenedentota bacterium]
MSTGFCTPLGEVTGLDYFGARYFSVAQGRFTSPDPLMSSAHVADPQTWNRYTYGLNNPLRFTDPLGLYVWDSSLGGNATDEELRERLRRGEANRIISRRNDIRSALAAGSGLSDARIRAAITAYGREGDPNGVTVGMGRLGGGIAGTATPRFRYNEASNSYKVDVSVVFREGLSGNDLVIIATHEGQHAEDAQGYAAGATAFIQQRGLDVVGGPLDLTKYAREVNAYNISSFAAQRLRMPTLRTGGQEIWNAGWREVDRDRLRSLGINNLLRLSPTYGLTPANPGTRYSQE